MFFHFIFGMVSFLFCLISFLIAMLLDCQNNSLGSNIFIAFFTASFLSFVSSTISYLIMRKNNITSYLGALQAYRSKFRRFYKDIIIKSNSDILSQDLQDLKNHFYDLNYNVYNNIQFFFVNKELPLKLDLAHKKILHVQGGLNCEHLDNLDTYSNDIDYAIDTIQTILKRLKNYIYK